MDCPTGWRLKVERELQRASASDFFSFHHSFFFFFVFFFPFLLFALSFFFSFELRENGEVEPQNETTQVAYDVKMHTSAETEDPQGANVDSEVRDTVLAWVFE